MPLLPVSFAASSGFGRTSVTRARSTARYAPSPIPVIAIPTRKTGNDSVKAMTARPMASRPAATAMGILWPGLMDRFGEVFGFPFVLEGFAFFIEAIFVGVYLFGWNRLSPRAHMLSAVPMILAGMSGTFFVVAANAWMNN